MPIRSMTGFARVARSTPSGEIVLSIKTVNHRGLDMHFHMPAEFDSVEPALRSALRMVLIGGGAGTLSYLVGRLLGVAIS